MKVKELIEKCDTSKSSEHWSFNIYDTTGNIEYGYINSVYPISNIHEAILNCEVTSYTIGYGSLYIKVEPICEAVYQSAERCEMDGYEHVHDDLYAKKCSEDCYSFAKIVGFN